MVILEKVGKNLKKMKKEILNLLVGKTEDKIMNKKDVLYELEKPLIKIIDIDIDNLCVTDPGSFDNSLSFSYRDLMEFMTVLTWFKISNDKWCVTNPEPELYYLHYNKNDEEIKPTLEAFFDLFSAKYVRMAVKQKIELSKKEKWKWSEVLKLYEEGLKSKK
jgi:hypothetical protein